MTPKEKTSVAVLVLITIGGAVLTLVFGAIAEAARALGLDMPDAYSFRALVRDMSFGIAAIVVGLGVTFAMFATMERTR